VKPLLSRLFYFLGDLCDPLGGYLCHAQNRLWLWGYSLNPTPPDDDGTCQF
jgi:hypothetical protein